MTTEEEPAPPRAVSKKRVQDRRCIATSEALAPDAAGLRFVRGPGDEIVLDLKGSLPGRGAWITATKPALGTALKKNAFARAFKAAAHLPKGMDSEAFADHVEAQLRTQALNRLGLARRSGHLILGRDNVLAAKQPSLAYLTPEGGSAPEIEKVAKTLASQGKAPHLPLPIERHPLSIALGQDSVHLLLLAKGPGPAALRDVMLWLGFQA